MGIDCDDETPIFPIVVGENDRALTLARELEERGIIITAIRPPTVPVGESRLRMTVTAAHSKEQLDYVAQTLHELLVDMNIHRGMIDKPTTHGDVKVSTGASVV